MTIISFSKEDAEKHLSDSNYGTLLTLVTILKSKKHIFEDKKRR